MTPQDLKLLHDRLLQSSYYDEDHLEIVEQTCDALLAYADLLRAVQTLIETEKGNDLAPHVDAFNRLMEMVK